MAIEFHALLWLLLPVAAASGWFAARRDTRRTKPVSGRTVSAEYLRSVSLLLNEQPDRAVEVFRRMLDTNTSADAVEMQLAMGSLFRRRGEVERAIHIHQELVSRSSLDEAQRSQARFELALDYQKAGLLDRAEVLFEELSQTPEHVEQALRSLVHIYEQERDWLRASAAQRRLMHSTMRDHSNLLAQYQCELGEQALQRGEYRLVDEYVREAIALDPGCVRARYLRGRVFAVLGENRKAITAWQEIEEIDPEFLDEIMHEIAAVFHRIGDLSGLREYLARLMDRHHGMNTLLYLSDAIRASAGVGETQRFLIDQMRIHPSVAGAERLMELFQDSGAPASREEVVLLKSVLLELMQQQRRYFCRQCGYQGEVLHWQCPACFEWMTMCPASRADAWKKKVSAKSASQPFFYQ